MKIGDRLNDILRTQSHSGQEKEMQALVLADLATNRPECRTHSDKAGNIYAYNGQGLPLVVAHMDTVHRIKPGQHLVPIQINDLVTGVFYPSMQQAGIGGDDKAGIFAALELVMAGKCNALFTVEEEIGAIGAAAADLKTLHAWGTPFAMQADRRGNSDIVFSIYGRDMAAKDFRKAAGKVAAKYGYKATHGALTDVFALIEAGARFPCFNCSAGYYNPHTDGEYIDLADLARAVTMFNDMADTLSGRTFNPPPKPATRSSYTASRWALDWCDWSTPSPTTKNATTGPGKGSRSTDPAGFDLEQWETEREMYYMGAHDMSPAEYKTHSAVHRATGNDAATTDEAADMDILGLNPEYRIDRAIYRSLYTPTT